LQKKSFKELTERLVLAEIRKRRAAERASRISFENVVEKLIEHEGVRLLYRSCNGN
jgi:hypothetical protein